MASQQPEEPQPSSPSSSSDSSSPQPPPPTAAAATAAAAAGQKRSRTSGDAPEDGGPLEASCIKQPRTEGSSLAMGDFPVDSPNPFQEPFCGSDVVLVVEGEKGKRERLHAHRSHLAVSSPYFRALLDTSGHFKESQAQEIELRSCPLSSVEVTHQAMVTFLRHLYPVHSFRPIADDDELSALFPLAEYFQCQHVRAKCEAYIARKLEPPTGDGNATATATATPTPNPASLPLASSLLYLHLCCKFNSPQFEDGLLAAASRKKSADIKAAEQFQWLSPETQERVLQKRFEYAEAALEAIREAGRSLTRNYGNSEIESGCDCSGCYDRVCTGFLPCKPCREAFVKKCQAE